MLAVGSHQSDAPPKKVPNIKDHIPKGFPVIEPVVESHLGLSVPEIIFTYGDKARVIPYLPHVITKMIKVIFRVLLSYKSLKKNIPLTKTETTHEITQELEKIAFDLGVKRFGVPMQSSVRS